MQALSPLAAILIAVFSAALGLGCATSVDVAFDEARDFSPYRTWEWLPGESRRVEAPRSVEGVLEAKLGRLVDQALSERGLVRSGPEEAPDLLVSAFLGIQRQHIWVTETGAMQTVHSFHDSPSYEIQSGRQVLHRFEKGYLVIAIADAAQRSVVWRGEFRGRYREAFWPHINEAVSILLARFPSR